MEHILEKGLEESSYLDLENPTELFFNDTGNLKNESDYNEDYNFRQDEFRVSLHTGIFLCIAYGLIFLMGTIGNSFVVAVVARSPRMRTPTNFFIANLALADLLVVVLCLPTTLISNIYTFMEPYWRYSLSVSVVWTVIYLFVFVSGLVGNSLVALVILRTKKSVTDYFLLNLVLADFLVLICCLPVTLLSNLITPWILGEWICKIVPYLQGVSVSASIDTLIAIAMERYLAICHPMKCQISSSKCRLIIGIIWTFSLSITLPWAIFFQLSPLPSQPDLLVCTENWPDPRAGNIYFIVAHLCLCYLFPLTLITICYALILRKVSHRHIPQETKNLSTELLVQRSKMKVIKMLLVVVILFAMSWLPLYAIFTRVKCGPQPMSEWEDQLIRTLTPIAQWLGSSNSCINPILYAFFNKKYRSGFKAVLTSRNCCSTLRIDLTKYDSTSRSSNRINMSTKKYNGRLLDVSATRLDTSLLSVKQI